MTDYVKPCTSISAAEVVGAELWLGTRYDGEYGDYPAEGVVVQSLDGRQHIKTLGTGQGLTGNLVRAIRFDPFSHTVWVATERGLNEIDRNFRVSRALFFYQDLGPAGVNVEVVSAWRKSNRLVGLYRELRITDAKGFHAAASQIPYEVRDALVHGVNDSTYHPDNVRRKSIDRAFAPG